MSDTREVGRFYVTFYCGPPVSTEGRTREEIAGGRTRVTIGSIDGDTVDLHVSDALKIAHELLELAHDRGVCGLDCNFHPCANDE